MRQSLRLVPRATGWRLLALAGTAAVTTLGVTTPGGADPAPASVPVAPDPPAASQPASTPARAAAGTADPGAPMPIDRALQLCASAEEATRRYCIEALRRRGDPKRHARARLRELASTDEALHAEAAAAIRELYGEPPPTYDPASEHRPDRASLLGLPTGSLTPRRQLAVHTIYGVLWDINYPLTRNIEVGARVTTPVGFFVFAPQFKVGATLGNFRVALRGMAGVFLPYWLDTDGLFLAGGGPALSFGSEDAYLNVGCEAYGLVKEDYNFAVVVPHAGGLARVTDLLSVGLNVVFPGTWTDRDIGYKFGEQAVVIYGIRIHGRQMWGDVSFAAPICKGCRDIYWPFVLGVPLLGFGFTL